MSTVIKFENPNALVQRLAYSNSYVFIGNMRELEIHIQVLIESENLVIGIKPKHADVKMHYDCYLFYEVHPYGDWEFTGYSCNFPEVTRRRVGRKKRTRGLKHARETFTVYEGLRAFNYKDEEVNL